MKSADFLALATCLSLVHGALAFTPSASTFGGRGNALQHGTQKQQHHTSRRGQQQVLQAGSSSSNSNWFTQFLTKPAGKKKNGNGAKAAKLKQQLLDTVRSTRRGVSTSEDQRQDIDDLIAALEPLNPNAEKVSSENLSALWILEWTTEREILFLMDKGLLGLPSGPVQQAIDVDARTLSNTMLFGPDSVFEVASSIDPEESGPRVNFKFEACKLKYRGFTVPLPPVGKGWFESVYLDEDFRVTRDVRGDVTVLVKGQS